VSVVDHPHHVLQRWHEKRIRLQLRSTTCAFLSSNLEP
jgi:hypothetical protein